MAGTITTKKGTGGPLGDIRTIDGPDATELFRLCVVRTALAFYAKTGMKIAPNFRMATVKATTGLRTNDKAAHLAKLDEMIEAQRALVTYVEQ